MIHPHRSIKTMVLAVALALPATLSIAAPVSDVVTTRGGQDIHQQFGRDSVYAAQTRQPVQTESRYSGGSSGMGGVFAGIGSAGAAAWDKVTGLFEPSEATSAAQSQPLVYGRAGGYVGTDQLALLDRARPASEASEPVTAGESITENDIRYPAAGEAELYGSPVAIAQSAPSPAVGTVEDQERNAMTDQPADAGAWKQADEPISSDLGPSDPGPSDLGLSDPGQ